MIDTARRLTRHLILAWALGLAWPAAADSPPRLAAAERVLTVAPFEAVPAQQVYDIIAVETGISITLDPKLGSQVISVSLGGRTLLDALDMVALAVQGYWFAIDVDEVQVVRDTPINRRNYEPIGIREFVLQHADAARLATQLRSVAEARNVGVDADRQAITVRDSYRRLAVIARLVEQADRAPSHAEVDVQLLAIPRPAFEEWFLKGQASRSPDSPNTVAEVDQLRERLAARLVAATKLGLTGERTGHFELGAAEGGEGAGACDLPLAIDVSARVHGASRGVTLTVKLVHPAGTEAGSSPLVHVETSQPVAAGGAHLIPLLLRDPGGRRVTSAAGCLLALIPTAVTPAEVAPGALDALWLGSEAQLRRLPGLHP